MKQKEVLLSEVNEIKNNAMMLVDVYRRDINREENMKFHKHDFNESLFQLLEKIQLELINEKSKQIIALMDKYQTFIPENWEKFNDNFKEYLTNKMDALERTVKNNVSREKMHGFEYWVKNLLAHYETLVSLPCDMQDIIENFAYTKKNYLLLGKNGAGKTRLLKHIQEQLHNKNAFVMSSNPSIKFNHMQNINVIFDKLEKLMKLFTDPYLSGTPNDYLTLILDEIDHLELDTESKSGETPINQKTKDIFMEIFNSLSTNRKVKYDIQSKEIRLYHDEESIPEYYAAEASDGEKSIIQFILYILLLPKNSYVFIDEPEAHLNGSLLCDLFDRLEKERSDLIFIYSSHEINFISSRENIGLILVDKFDGANHWRITPIDSYQDIPVNILTEIIGTKKDILLVEGKEGHSLDSKIYKALFPQYKVISLGSCEKVIENCRAFNSDGILELKGRKYFGIVDNDFRNEDEIQSLNESKIDVLKCNEIENLLFCSELLQRVCNEVKAYGKEVAIKEDALKKIENAKKGIIQDYIKKVYPKTFKMEKVLYEDVNQVIGKIKALNQNSVEEFQLKLNDFINKLEQLLTQKNYDLIIKEIPFKGLKASIKCAGIMDDIYIVNACELIEKDEELKKRIIKEHFHILFEELYKNE